MSDGNVLGELETLPLREVWSREAQDFTPWLLRNAHILAAAIGLEGLDLHESEHSVGGFSLDLFGKVEGTNDVVIVENQLEGSDHTHFGQLMTYAGGTDAKYIIWISPKFRPEHLFAIEWLNNGTTDNINFFAVEVSAVRIGDSLPAALFKVVSQPNTWARTIKASTTDVNNEKDELTLSFWNSLIPKMRSAHPEWKSSHKGTKNKFISLSTGIPDTGYTMSFNSGQIKSELTFTAKERQDNQDRFDKLLAHKDEIEDKYGSELIWHFPDNNIQASIRTVKSAEIENEGSWSDIITWLLTEQTKLREAVKGYLK